jgi:glutathione S-transferase/uncharacterized protein YciI
VIELFTYGSTNGHKVAIALEELGFEYELRTVDVFAGEGQTPEFLALNPVGKIPVIRDREADLVLTESDAILLYLADKAGRLIPTSGNERTRALELLFLQASLQGPMFGQRMHFSIFSNETVPYGIRRYEEQGERNRQADRSLTPGAELLPRCRVHRRGYRVFQLVLRCPVGRVLVRRAPEPEGVVRPSQRPPGGGARCCRTARSASAAATEAALTVLIREVSMLIVLLRFSNNKSVAGQFAAAHGDWIKQGFDDGVFLLVGSLQPHLGGGIVAQHLTRAELEARVAADPFVAHDIVKAEIFELVPSRADPRLDFLR